MDYCTSRFQMRCHCNEVVSQSGPKPVFRSTRRRWAGHWDNWSQLFGRRRLCQILLHLFKSASSRPGSLFCPETKQLTSWPAVLQTLHQYACQPLCLSQKLSVPGRIIIFHRWDCHATAVVGPDRSTHLSAWWRHSRFVLLHCGFPKTSGVSLRQ